MSSSLTSELDQYNDQPEPLNPTLEPRLKKQKTKKMDSESLLEFFVKELEVQERRWKESKEEREKIRMEERDERERIRLEEKEERKQHYELEKLKAENQYMMLQALVNNLNKK